MEEHGEKPIAEACLEYSAALHRWQLEQPLAEGGVLLIWMNHDVFTEYVNLAVLAAGYAEPTPLQRQAVKEQQCQRCSYWTTLAQTASRDPRISMRVLGGTRPGVYQHAVPEHALPWDTGQEVRRDEQ